MIVLDRQSPADAPGVEDLLDRAFGEGRHRKTAQRLRDHRALALALVARDHAPWGERLVGTLTFWDIAAGPVTPALLLGPLAVDADYRCRRLGALLVRRGLDAAREAGHGAVLLVGDAPYYGRFGFTREPMRDLVMPGPVDEARFLGLELRPGALAGATGLVRPAGRTLPAGLLPAAA
jgi:predicted N-acetyltransferase YhbS